MKTTLRSWFDNNKNKKWFMFLDSIVYRVFHHKVFPLGGQLAYFLVLSIFPFLIALLNILDFTAIIDTVVISNVIRYLPTATQNIIYTFIENVSTTSSPQLFSLSLLGGIWSASLGIRQLIRAVNSAFGFEETRNFIKINALALIFTIVLILLIILLLLTRIFGSKILELVTTLIPIEPKLYRYLEKMSFFVPLVYMIFAFFSLYRFSPNVKPKDLDGKSTLPGAIFSTFGIIIASKIFNFYVANFGKFSITYGTLTGIVLLFLWLYLMSIIIVLGAEVNATCYEYFQGHLEWPRKESIVSELLKKQT